MNKQCLANRIDMLVETVKNQQNNINKLESRFNRLEEENKCFEKELSPKVSILSKDAQEKIEKLKKAAEGIVDG